MLRNAELQYMATIHYPLWDGVLRRDPYLKQSCNKDIAEAEQAGLIERKNGGFVITQKGLVHIKTPHICPTCGRQF